MKKFLALLTFACMPFFASAQTYRHVDALFQSGITAPTIYYVRADGGTRYSAKVTNGQCDGKADAPYPGTGTNQHCAFGDVRYFWTDGSYTTNPKAGSPSWGWLGAPGDVYLIRGGPWRVGQTGSGNNQGLGLQGDPYANTPVPPNNSIIEGENFASCSLNAKTRTVGNATQLFGGFATAAVLDLTGSSGVQVSCLDITDHGSCVIYGSGNQCSKNYPLSDFADEGIQTSNTTTNLTVTNVALHGFANTGWYGPLGTGFVSTNIGIWGNSGSNWNMDLGNGSTGTGTFLLQNFYVGWGGFSEEFPIVDSLPFFNALDSNNGGYGDCFGTTTATSNPPWHLTFRNGVVENCTQDGLDFLHLDGPGSTLTVDAVRANGNMGNQLKVGTQSTVTNSEFTANCNALSTTIPGTPANYNKGLTGFCRAGNEAVLLAISDGSTTTFENNTLVGSGSGDLGGIVCNGTCTTKAALVYENNIQIGYNGVSRFYDGSGAKGGPWAQTGSMIDHNFCYGAKNCAVPQETNAFTAAPQLTDITWHPYGVGNFSPTSASSNVIGVGVAEAGIATDFNGSIRPFSPSIGAEEFAGKNVVAPPPPPILMTPTITWTTPAAITAGTALSIAQLNATASTAGKMTYTPAMGSVPAAGTVTLSVVFTPSDTVDFTSATKTVQLTVMPAVVVTPPPTTIYPLSWSVPVTIPASTIQPSAITPPAVIVPAKTVNCPFTQASATAPIVPGICK